MLVSSLLINITSKALKYTILNLKINMNKFCYQVLKFGNLKVKIFNYFLLFDINLQKKQILLSKFIKVINFMELE